jgi:hypothetical protein
LRGPCREQFALGLLGGAEECKLLLIDVPVDYFPHQFTQPTGRDRV